LPSISIWGKVNVMLHKKYAQLDLITPKMLHSTVMCDERTCLWYGKLLTRPSVIHRVKDSASGSKLFESYSHQSRLMKLFLILAVGFGISSFFLHGMAWVLGAGILTAFLASIKIMFRVRDDLATLAVHLLELDRDVIVPGTTLFQLGEIYARRYGGMSLVDVIWFWDRWLRDVILFVFMLSFGVFFMPFWFTAVLLTASCIIASYLIKLWFMSTRSA
ncbi:MAG: hypothetical protein V2A70_00105, partial [Candidatus Omnitrophota bacterium]